MKWNVSFSMKKVPALLIKASVSLALLILLFYRADMGEVKRLADSIDWWFLLGGLVCISAGLVLSSYKWQAILRLDGIHSSLSDLVKLYLIGAFFNNFLPTSIGGDAVRAYYVSRAYGKPAAAVSSILTERFSGLSILILLPVVAFYPSAVLVPSGISELLAWGLAIIVVLIGAFLLPATRRTCGKLLPQRVRLGVERIAGSIGRYLSDSRTLLIVVLCSLFFNGLVILCAWFVAGSLDLNLRMIDLMVVVPLVVLLTLIPFSLNGLGIREGGFIFFLSQFGISQAEALSFSLLNYLLILVVSVVGGIVFGSCRADYGLQSSKAKGTSD